MSVSIGSDCPAGQRELRFPPKTTLTLLAIGQGRAVPWRRGLSAEQRVGNGQSGLGRGRLGRIPVDVPGILEPWLKDTRHDKTVFVRKDENAPTAVVFVPGFQQR
jgi:hypothetical protein